MKVVVRCANNRITKADMEREIERLFQENKDLRVYVGHLHDELSLAQQQSEARRQVICERDKLIQELNDQITAQEEEYEIASKAMDKYSSRLQKSAPSVITSKPLISRLRSGGATSRPRLARKLSVRKSIASL